MYRRILVPLDSSELAERSLVDLKEIAGMSERVPEVILFMVTKPVIETIPVYYEEVRGSPASKVQKSAEAYARDYLSKVADRLKEDGIAAQTVLVQGDPAKEILNYAENNQIDLIIISSFGRSGASRWALGKVTDRVVHYSRVPVLVVRPV